MRGLKKNIKSIIGDLLVYLRPKKALELSEKGMTILAGDEYSTADYLIRDAMIRRAEKNKDFDTLAKFQKSFWVNQGHDFFDRTDNSFKEAFLPDWAFVFELLKHELTSQDIMYNTLVEIGTGNGKVLEYLSTEFPNIENFIGIDLSRRQIELNKLKFQELGKLEFVAADAVDWVEEHGKDRMIFVTSGGVLEYFTEETLLTFLKKLNSLGSTIFVAIEPNGTDHDFVVNPSSQPYGHERSFSHNYEHLFEASGFKLWHLSRKEDPENDYFYLSFFGAKN